MDQDHKGEVDTSTEANKFCEPFEAIQLSSSDEEEEEDELKPKQDFFDAQSSIEAELEYADSIKPEDDLGLLDAISTYTEYEDAISTHLDQEEPEEAPADETSNKTTTTTKCGICSADLGDMADVMIASSCLHLLCKECLPELIQTLNLTSGLMDQRCPCFEHDENQLQGCDGVMNMKEFQCPVCLLMIEKGHGFILESCFHACCKNCLVDYIRVSVCDVACPYTDCKSFLSPREVEELAPKDVFKMYENRCMEIARISIPNSCHCKSPGCLFWGLLDEGINTAEGQDAFLCPICEQVNCLKCKGIHNSDVECPEDLRRRQSIEELSEDALEAMIKAGESMRCPKCTIVVEKIDGCDGLTCLHCKTELCWATKGLRWGPDGKGDSTGGCQCNVGGLKCHPECRNCH